MAEQIITKRCGHCKITKPTSDFYRDRARKDGLCAECKDCQKAYYRSHTRRLHATWRNMNDRCRNKQNRRYKNYGGRGIKVCERWDKFENFVTDMGPTYQPGLTIERRNNDGPYCPKNCRWATHAEQMINMRTNHLLTYCGKTQPVAVWARELGMLSRTILSRLRLGWPIERILSEPVHTEFRVHPI